MMETKKVHVIFITTLATGSIPRSSSPSPSPSLVATLITWLCPYTLLTRIHLCNQPLLPRPPTIIDLYAPVTKSILKSFFCGKMIDVRIEMGNPFSHILPRRLCIGRPPQDKSKEHEMGEKAKQAVAKGDSSYLNQGRVVLEWTAFLKMPVPIAGVMIFQIGRLNAKPIADDLA